MRESYDEYGAAGRLGVPVAAWRWAAGSGLVPPADAGPWEWSRPVVEAVDAEAVRAGLLLVDAWQAADRLTRALGDPLVWRPAVTASAVGHLVRAGLLVGLGGDTATPDVHADQVAALARRRDLPALLDRHVPLGPDQAARRLGVRRADFDAAVRLGWIEPVSAVDIDYKKARGGTTTVPLYRALDVALLPVLRPSVDWHAVRAARPGTRSLLTTQPPAAPGGDRLLLADVARICGVRRAAVVAWRRRYDDFPVPAGGTVAQPEFDRAAVAEWLLAQGRIVPLGPEAASLTVTGAGGEELRMRLYDAVLDLDHDAAGEDRLSAWCTEADADALAGLAAGEFGAVVRRLAVPGTDVLAVTGDVRVTDRYRSGEGGGLRVTLAWPAGLRGTAARAVGGGLVRHGVPYAAPEDSCPCELHSCGGLTPKSWCPEHGTAAVPVMEWHPGGGIRCADLAGRRTVAGQAARTVTF
ncbi:hypothetical protein [Streptomyces sp. NPDC059783]|uniref:hypothetical protein n=1 Tax=Streptomyces sp. NPDC059783 TaxID=3346944 RepID=UPI0036690678